ncbi:MAG: type I glutamate--ammonia ligase [Rickettsiales bacterium]|jgi:glutamine synthetase|nr:type I glutamate--ammonia ligase [Rickettsiales bacterium]
MAIIEGFFNKIKEQNIKLIDFRFTDSSGSWHNISYESSNIDQGVIENGIVFNGSLIKGWRDVTESDMILKPDVTTFCMDPFASYPTALLLCNVLCPNTLQDYNRDPRSIALRAEKHLVKTEVGSHIYFGAELEFFLFDDVKFHNERNNCGFSVDSEEHPSNSNRTYDSGNLGHRPKLQKGSFPVAPIDSASGMRSEMMETLKDMGVWARHHHHEVAPGQNELGFNFNTLVNTADNVQKYKYVVHNTAHSFGKSATFMPKPLWGDNGNGMHLHQSIIKGGKNLFFGNYYAGLSKEALYYIGGIMKHSRALNAFTNASTNSYKRLIQGGSVPTAISYSGTNRSTTVRIPHASSAKDKRVEIRFSDPSANPYLALSAVLMAGLDGINKRINPGDPEERNLYTLPKSELLKKSHLAKSLQESLDALDKDREFLLQGRVFTNDQIDAYIKLKMEEVEELNSRPHPIEYKNYYSC